MPADVLQFLASAGAGTPLLLLLVKATVILGVAAAATLVMQRATAGSRHMVWLVTLGSLLVVPALATFAPVSIPVLPAAVAAPTTPRTAPVAIDDAPPSNAADTELGGGSAVSRDTRQGGVASEMARGDTWRERLQSAPPLALLFTLWALVAAAIAASLARAAAIVRRIVRDASPLQAGEWVDPLYEIADRLGLDNAPRLLRSDDVDMPFACGVLQPTIVLPSDCESWSLARRRAVLLHELAHIRRRDLLGHTVGRIACAIYWFHPLVWTAAKHLRSESERACDDIALACGAPAADYAEHLLDIVTSVRGNRTPAVAIAMARRKDFEGRMLAILDPGLARTTPNRQRSLGLVGAIAASALLIGAVVPAPRAANAAAPGGAASADSPVDSEPELQLADRADAHVTAGSSAPNDTALRDVMQSATREVIAEAIASAEAEATGKAVASAVAPAVTRIVPGVVTATLEGLFGSAEEADDDERATLLARVLRTDSSANLRRVAAWGLADHADAAVAEQALAEAVRRDASIEVREMAAWALSEARSEGVGAAALHAAVRGDADARVRATAAWALGDAGGESSIAPLVAALGDASSSVRTRALWAIGSIGPRSAPPAVTALLRSDDAKLRKLASWVLYEIEDPSSAPALAAAVRAERDADVQGGMLRALATLGETSVGVIQELVESSDPRIRSMAVHALAGGDAFGPWPWPWPQPRPHP